MIIHTHFDRFNTIISDSAINVGISPIALLSYGNDSYSRILLHFDVEKIKSMVEDNNLLDMSKMRHVIKIRNCGAIDLKNFFLPSVDMMNPGFPHIKASSFDMIAFEVPCDWDGGKGFDFAYNETNQYVGSRLVSEQGASWYCNKTNFYWTEYDNPFAEGEKLKNGIYSSEFLENQLERYNNGESGTAIVAKERFRVGCENVELDITDTVNKWILEGNNNGLCLCFNPRLEIEGADSARYISFFTHKTQNFYEPYLETIYNDWIDDDRANFVLGKKNRLYLYSNINGEFKDLDEMPTCSIDGEEKDVFHQSKGVYFVEHNLPVTSKPNTMYFDTWSNLKYDGVELEDVELDFTTVKGGGFFNIGSNVERKPRYVPHIYGINYDEKVFRNGDRRKINIVARKPFEQNVADVITNVEYRIHTLQDNNEIEVIPYHKCERSVLENYFYINMEELVPGDYFIDVRISYNGEKITHSNVTKFTVVNKIERK